MISLTHDRVIGYPHFVGEENEIQRGFPKHVFRVTPRFITERTFSSWRSPVLLLCHVYTSQHAFCIQCRHPRNSLGLLPSICCLPGPQPCADLGLPLTSCSSIFGLTQACLLSAVGVTSYPRSRDQFPPLPPYTVPSQLRKCAHNLLGPRNQIRSCPGHLFSALT